MIKVCFSGPAGWCFSTPPAVGSCHWRVDVWTCKPFKLCVVVEVFRLVSSHTRGQTKETQKASDLSFSLRLGAEHVVYPVETVPDP